MSDGTLSTAGIASFDGSNALFGPGALANCNAPGFFTAAQCASIQNTFLAPASASALGAVDSLSGDIVDFQKVSGNVGRDAGRGSPFVKFDTSLHKSFSMPRAENVKLELRFDAFNVFNHSNLIANNSNDVLNALAFSATGAGIPKANFFTCTACVRPNGTLMGSGGQVLHLADLQKGGGINFSPWGGIGDPGADDAPRKLQLSFHVRF